MRVRQAFVDESGRGSAYYLCAAVAEADEVGDARHLARQYLLPNQRRWHFTEERAARRRQILDGIVSSGLITAFVAHGTGNHELVRARCLTELANAFTGSRTTRVVIESRDVRDAQDRRTLAGALRPIARPFE